MNKEKIAPGLILIGIGLLFVLRNLGIIHWWTIGSLWRFWPLILVVVGINIIFRSHPVVTTVTWLGFFAIVIGFAVTNPATSPWHQQVNMNTTRHQQVDLTVPMDDQWEEGLLTLNVGALKLKLEAEDSELFSVTGFPYQPDFRVEDAANGRKKEIYLSTGSVTIGMPYDEFGESVITLHPALKWHIDAKMGAAATEMDIRDLTVEGLTLDVGAGDFRVIMSEPTINSRVKINAGASQVVLDVPKEINARIEADNVLSQTSIDGRYWHQQGSTYYSKNYDDAKPFVDISVKMGVGRFEVISR